LHIASFVLCRPRSYYGRNGWSPWHGVWRYADGRWPSSWSFYSLTNPPCALHVWCTLRLCTDSIPLTRVCACATWLLTCFYPLPRHPPSLGIPIVVPCLKLSLQSSPCYFRSLVLVALLHLSTQCLQEWVDRRRVWDHLLVWDVGCPVVLPQAWVVGCLPRVSPEVLPVCRPDAVCLLNRSLLRPDVCSWHSSTMDACKSASTSPIKTISATYRSLPQERG